jgi:hypothetical protein
MKKMAEIIDSYESLHGLATDAANAAERHQAAAEGRPARKIKFLTFKEECIRMAQDGWLSGLLADSIAEYKPWPAYHELQEESDTLFQLEPAMVKAKKYSRENKAFHQTRTFQAWRTGQQVPVINSSRGVLARLRYSDPNNTYEQLVKVDREAGLLWTEHDGKRLVAFLADFPDATLSLQSDTGVPRSIANVEAEEIMGKEGAVSFAYHLLHERDGAIVTAKRRDVMAKTGRLACSVCGFDFFAVYGEIGAEFCEVHHLRPLAESGMEVETRLEDLAIVCSNCHRMLHRHSPLLTIEELRSRIQSASSWQNTSLSVKGAE